MVVKKMIKKKSKEVVREYNSDSESEITYDYKDDDDSEDDDSETEDSVEEESDTAQSPKGKKRKGQKRVSFAEPGSDDDDDDDEANDASDEDNEEEDNDDDEDTTERPRKKKRKISKRMKTRGSDDDDTDSEGDDDDDTDSEDDDADSKDSEDDDADSKDSEDKGSDEDGEKEEEAEEEDEVKAHAGFANALSNILGKKTVSSKKVILALGKTDKEIRKLKESKLPPEEKTFIEILTAEELEERRLKRKLWLEQGQVKPNALEKKRERELKMIGTRGVVQLFNAVRKQQKMMTENLSGTSTERKKDMVIESMNKKSFINLLQNTKVDVSMGSAEKETIQAKEDERKIWSVLKDDFVIGTGNMKDWDKQQDMDML